MFKPMTLNRGIQEPKKSTF
jgi:hypothetical protein